MAGSGLNGKQILPGGLPFGAARFDIPASTLEVRGCGMESDLVTGSGRRPSPSPGARRRLDTTPTTADGVHTPSAQQVRHLQRTAGNAATTALLRRAPSNRPVVQRACGKDLGTPSPQPPVSTKGTVGWKLLFAAGCDELLPGEEAKIDLLKPGNDLSIHGYASKEGPADLNDRLSALRANRVAALLADKRADCPVIGVFRHGASPVAAPGVPKDVNPAGFWRSVVIEQVTPAPGSGERWLDSQEKIRIGRALLARARKDPTTANLDVIAANRAVIRDWLESTPKTMAGPGVRLGRQNLDDFRRLWASAEDLWTGTDTLLATHRHPKAAEGTRATWAAVGPANDPKFHAHDVPAGAKYHIDLFGEGFHRNAINIGMALRSETTAPGSRVPTPIYRRFSSKDVKANGIPIADHVADVVTAESGPINFPGVIEEIARIIAPGGTIIVVGPKLYEEFHDRLATLTGGRTTKRASGSGGVETRIVVPTT